MNNIQAIGIVRDLLKTKLDKNDKVFYNKISSLFKEIYEEQINKNSLSKDEIKSLNSNLIEEHCRKSGIRYEYIDKYKSQIRIEKKMDIYPKSRKYHIFPTTRGVIDAEQPISEFIDNFLRGLYES